MLQYKHSKQQNAKGAVKNSSLFKSLNTLLNSQAKNALALNCKGQTFFISRNQYRVAFFNLIRDNLNSKWGF